MELRRHIVEVDREVKHWGGFSEYKTIASKERLEFKNKQGEWEEIPVHYSSFEVGDKN